MSSIYRPTIIRYLDARGNRVPKGTPGAKKVKEKSDTWRGKFKGADGVCRTVTLCDDRDAAQEMFAEIAKRARRESRGDIDPFEDHRKRPLTDHLVDFKAHLEAKGNGARHVMQTCNRIQDGFDACGFKWLADLKAGRVANWLADRRKPTRDKEGNVIPGLSVASSNHHLVAVKSFGNWLVRDRRCSENPFAHLSRLNARVDVRRERRTLSGQELGKLLKATKAGAEYRGLTGESREMLYLTALFTGLRASELASLTEGSFDLTADPPTVTVEACYSKHRREDVLPLHLALATQFADWLAKRRQTALQAISDDSVTLLIRPATAPSPKGKRSAKTVSAKPVERIWPGTWIERSAEMLRDDLEAAGIPYSTDDGVFDFHAFRHQFITSLAKNGVHPKLAQTLARHSTITLTMDRYSHVGLLDMTAALESLPCVPTPIEQITLATGTDDAAGCTLVAPMVALDPPKLTFHQVPSDAFSVSEIESITTSENPHFPLGNEGCLIPVITGDNEWDRWDSNPEPKDYESSALTVELRSQGWRKI